MTRPALKFLFKDLLTHSRRFLLSVSSPPHHHCCVIIKVVRKACNISIFWWDFLGRQEKKRISTRDFFSSIFKIEKMLNIFFGWNSEKHSRRRATTTSDLHAIIWGFDCFGSAVVYIKSRLKHSSSPQFSCDRKMFERSASATSFIMIFHYGVVWTICCVLCYVWWQKGKIFPFLFYRSVAVSCCVWRNIEAQSEKPLGKNQSATVVKTMLDMCTWS